jgi:hypothetical protein
VVVGYQFVHYEAYAKVSKKGSGGTGHATEGRTADEVIAEAAREFGNYPHVKNPKAPAIVDACRDGYTFDDLKADYEKACNSQVTMANGKTRKNRSTALTLATMVCSYPIPCDEIKTKEDHAKFHRWQKRVINHARSEFGDDYRMAVRHTDEKFPHLHIFAVAPDARRLHPGLEAAKSAENCGKKGGDLGKAASEGLRAAQDRYYEAVGKPEGQARLGPRLTRKTHAEWLKVQFANEKMAEMLNNPNKLRGEAEAKAAHEWGEKSFIAKVSAYGKKNTEHRQFSAKNRAIERAERMAAKKVSRAEAQTGAALARAKIAEGKVTKLEGEKREMEAALRNKTDSMLDIKNSRDVLDTVLSGELPHMTKKRQRYVREVLESQAEKTASAKVAAACAPAGRGEDQQIMAGDDEATRTLKRETNAQNAAARNSFNF